MTNAHWLERARRHIPYSTQTISKLPHPGTEPVFPYFVRDANGARFTDVDGRTFLDFFCSCGPIILGHACKAVDDEVKRQIDLGFLYSTNSTLEVEMAEELIGLFPYLSWVKFMKTGADAVSAAVRIARARTGKENVLQYGYHGWHDWYQSAAGGGRLNGIPDSNRKHARAFPYNDSTALERELAADDNVAAVVMTPYDWYHEPHEGYLQHVRRLCTQYEVQLIFDEVKTGFRLGLTGAQGKFGVEPDMAVFAKAISNGYPLAAIMGKDDTLDVMNQMTTLISTTYAGDALALAAGLATIRELRNGEVLPHLEKIGHKLMMGLCEVARRHGLKTIVRGAPTLATFEFQTERKIDWLQFYTGWINHHLNNGIFIKLHYGFPSYTLMNAHDEPMIAEVLNIADDYIGKAMQLFD